MDLMTRDQFREKVFERDAYKCVVCKQPAQDAHHIIERRLFDNGGYFLENGASLCGSCHLEAESTKLSADCIRDLANITRVVLPDHLYRNQSYDKWGNPIQKNGRRLKGELFEDPSVQKILRSEPGIIDLFDKFVKYPRTYHLPWSPGATKNDRIIDSTNQFKNQEVVVTVKMDGENTTIYNDHIHARSLDSETHPSQTWVRNLHGKIGYLIPDGWRVCGENLYAKHSIAYDNLESFFLVFSIWNNQNICCSWEDTITYAKVLGLPMVHQLMLGNYNEPLMHLCDTIIDDGQEGYVVRLTSEFHYAKFRKSVAKFVRKGHVGLARHHWKWSPVVPNKMKNEEY